MSFKNIQIKLLNTRKLTPDEQIPYELLLLADETIEAINKYITKSSIYVLESEGKQIAAYALFELNKTEVEIKNIAVHTACQGYGIGKFLLHDATIKAAENGYRFLLIGTAENAIKQLNLYRKAGFNFHALKKDFYIKNYPHPIIEEGIQLRNMVILRKAII